MLCGGETADRKSRHVIRVAAKRKRCGLLAVVGCYPGYDKMAIERAGGVDAIFVSRKRAFLKAQDGCDNNCIISIARGRSRSRCIEEIVEEAKRKSGEGVKEIVLTWVCLDSFDRVLSKKVDLIGLIEANEQIPQIHRIRLSSIEASDVTDKLIKKMAGSLELCPHLHIPFQSGDD